MYYKFMSICGRRVKNLCKIQRTKVSRMKVLQKDCFRKGNINLSSTYYMLSNGNKKYLPFILKEL